MSDLYLRMGSLQDTPENGTLFAERYKIERVLGTGGMGKVYLAADTMLGGEKIALKVLNSELGSDENLRKRFLREVQLTRKVNHPNVVRTYDVGSQDGQLFFTMEYVEGDTLKNKVAVEPLEPLAVVQLLLQVCAGLHAIHEFEIIHRDMKSSNIIITTNGTAKITDFGVAKPGASDLTGRDELVGSATHMAPEVWRQGDITRATDIYALGVVMYETLTGVLPFDGQTPHELMWKHLKQNPLPPVEINPTIPRWLNGIVMRMLEKEPSARPQSVDEISTEMKLKLRKSTLEDARKVKVLGVDNKPEKEPSDDASMLPPSLFDDELSEDVQNDLLSYAPDHNADLHPLGKISFSAQPAVLTLTDIEESSAGERASLAQVRLARRVFAKKTFKSRLLVHSLIGLLVPVATSLCLWWWISIGVSSFPQKLWGMPNPVARTLMLLITALFLLPTATSPLFAVATPSQGLRKSFQLWLTFTGILFAAAGVFTLWNTIRFLYWTSNIPSLKESLILLPQVLLPAIQNITEAALLEVRGSYHGVVLTKVSLGFQAVNPKSISALFPYYLLLTGYACFTALLFRRKVLGIEHIGYIPQATVALCFIGFSWGISLLASYVTQGVYIPAPEIAFEISHQSLIGVLGLWSVLWVVGFVYALRENNQK